MPDLSTIPAPSPDVTAWRSVTPAGDGWYRLYDDGTRVQFAYPDGHTWSMELDS